MVQGKIEIVHLGYLFEIVTFIYSLLMKPLNMITVNVISHLIYKSLKITETTFCDYSYHVVNVTKSPWSKMITISVFHVKICFYHIILRSNSSTNFNLRLTIGRLKTLLCSYFLFPIVVLSPQNNLLRKKSS